jgi:Tol biopolymer transport system component
MDELEARAVDGTNEDPLDLTFSPDGQSLAYFVPNGQPPAFILKKIQIRGGTPVPLCPTEWPYGASWQGDTILFAQGSTSPGILSVPAAGGAPTMLVQVSSGEYVSQPHFVGDGRLLLFTFRASVSVPWSDAEIVVQAPGEASRTVLIRGGTDARPIGVDRLVYYRNGTVFAVSFDVRDRTTRGGAVPVIEGVQAALATGAGIFSVAERTGTLVFLPGDDGSNSPRQLVWIDRMGKEQPIPAPVRNYSQPRLSPEGTRIAVVVHNGQSSGLAIWDLSRDILSALTPADGRDRMPLWSPDGRSVIYRSIDADGQGRLMRIDASGAGAPELLLELGSMSVLSADGYPESISHDGRLLFIRRIRPTPDIFVLALDGDRTPRPLIATPMMEMHGQISPDGRWLAYTFSDASGPGTVFLRPYPDVSGGRWQLAPNRASDPVWARSSRELFFIDIDQNLLMSVTVQPGPVFGRAVEVLDNQPYLPAAGSGTDYDLSPDGQRFLMIKPETAVTGGAADRSALVVVTHWVDALRAQLK